MKTHRIYMVFDFLILSLMLYMAGCKYDVANPLWEESLSTPYTPTITQVAPAEAGAGVNLITISGTSFGLPPGDSTIVYFDNLKAEIVSVSSTAITVRRPNLVTDTTTIKVVCKKAYLVAKKGPYKITAVEEVYGSFLDNVLMNALTVDKDENVYIAYGDTSQRVWKVTPDGEKHFLTRARRIATDLKVGPDGRLYLLGANREIDVVNPATNTAVLWHKLKTSKQLRYGDFDSKGYLFAGGMKTDLWVIRPDSTSEASNMYATDSVFSVKVHGGYIYVAAKKTSDGQKAIWRHAIGDNGAIGQPELFYDLTDNFGGAWVRSLTLGFVFAADGTLFISSNYTPYSLMYFNNSTQKLDVFYKDIIPGYGRQIVWGNGNYVYMVTGNATPAQDWLLNRINMGTTAAP